MNEMNETNETNANVVGGTTTVPEVENQEEDFTAFTPASNPVFSGYTDPPKRQVGELVGEAVSLSKLVFQELTVDSQHRYAVFELIFDTLEARESRY